MVPLSTSCHDSTREAIPPGLVQSTSNLRLGRGVTKLGYKTRIRVTAVSGPPGKSLFLFLLNERDIAGVKYRTPLVCTRTIRFVSSSGCPSLVARNPCPFSGRQIQESAFIPPGNSNPILQSKNAVQSIRHRHPRHTAAFLSALTSPFPKLLSPLLESL